MAIPIIFIHRNNSNYLSYTLAQAQASNPASPVIMIGDLSNRYAGVEHQFIADYCVAADQFGQVYKHLSTNPISYECFCFQRWFILQEFMAQQRLEACLYLDSDVMLYANATQEHERLQNLDLALPQNVPSCTYINRLQAIEQFCDFVTDLYTDPTTFADLELTFKRQLRQATTTGICDMVAFEKYRLRYPQQVGDLCEVVDGYSYDACITADQGYITNGDGIKKIEWVDGKPVGQRESGLPVSFRSLHFQGFTKSCIHNFFTGVKPAQHLITEVPTGSSVVMPVTTMDIATHPVDEHLPQPDSAEAVLAWGNALVQQGSVAQAVTYFQTAIQLQPDLIGAYINLGGVYVELGKPEAAIHCYQNALRVDPTDSRAYSNLSYAYSQLGQYEIASRYLTMANALQTLEQYPTWAETYRNLGLAYLYFDNLEGAIANFQQALQIDPTFVEVQAPLQMALQQWAIVQYRKIQTTLREINWLIVPDWAQLDLLYPELIQVIQAIFRHPDRTNITLLIDTSNADQDEVAVVIDQVVFAVLMDAALDVSEQGDPAFYPVFHLPGDTWAMLAPQIQARIVLTAENSAVLGIPSVQSLVAIAPSMLMPQS